MIQFDIKRFGKLARWSLTLDMRFYVKTLLTWFAAVLLLFLAFGFQNWEKGHQNVYYILFITTCYSVLLLTVMGPVYMFYSMTGPHDRRTLHLLPASNLEKYLMRYASSLVLLPGFLLLFFASDVLQYAFFSMLGKEGVMLETQFFAEKVALLFQDVPESNVSSLPRTLGCLLLWVHSVYAVGATLFRSHKYSWVLTTLVLIAGWMLLSTILGGYQNLNALWWNHHGLFNRLFLVLTVVNFWLSYRLFYRWQVAGKYVNI